MLLNTMLSDLFVKETRFVAKRTEEVLEPMNIEALKDYSERLENQRRMGKLIARIFSGSLNLEAANYSSHADKKAVNS